MCYIYLCKIFECYYCVFVDVVKLYKSLVCYVVKVNLNIVVFNILVCFGFGFDIVLKGEFVCVIEVGGDVSKVVFFGVVKIVDEIMYVFKLGIKCFNVEFVVEFECILEVVMLLNFVVFILICVNFDIDVKMYFYILIGLKENKFGIDI